MSETTARCAIDYLEIPAPDVDKAKAFYSRVFGWALLDDYSPNYCGFKSGTISGGFVASLQVSGHGPLIVLYADDLDDRLVAIEAHGGTVTTSKTKYDWGGYRAEFTDPNGNRLAIWSTK